MSAFSPESFLDAQITEASVKRPPITAGTELIGIIKDIKPRTFSGKKDPSATYFAMDPVIEFDMTQNPVEMARVGLPKVTIQDGIFLNLTDSGAIDMSPGKNSRLRQYREALNMNTAGEVFSFRAMVGRTIRCKIKHDTFEGELFDKIDSVAKP